MSRRESPESYRLGSEIKRQLANTAKTENLSKAAVLRAALNQYFEKKLQK